MTFWQNLLRILDSSMETPTLFGWFHILWLAITVVGTILLCRYYRGSVSRMILTVTLVVIALEIYKQINYSFSYENGIRFYYQWYAFPFQFCSTPMYVGLLAGLTKKGKLHESACAYLASYAIFAGLCVMIYPGDVFIRTIGINIQTMICHGSMITIGVYLLYTGYVKVEHKSILKAIPVFVVCFLIATAMNILAKTTGLLEEHTFNMFYMSPYLPCTLPVVSVIQPLVGYPVSLVLYLAVFTFAAYLMLLIAIGCKNLTKKHQKAAV